MLLLVEWLFGDTLVAFASDLLRGLDAVPQWIIDVIVIGTRILAVVVLGGGLVWMLFGVGGGCWPPSRWRAAGRADGRLARRLVDRRGRDSSTWTRIWGC